MLIVLAGLPASGKSAIAVRLATELRCAILSVDPIEAALWRAGIDRGQPTGLAAYVVAEDLAREQLRIGADVIVDAVNDAELARQQWRSLAAEQRVAIAFVEVICSDPEEHRRRLETRRRPLAGFAEPTWDAVRARSVGFDGWTDARLTIDSMLSLDENLPLTLGYLRRVREG
ncbi:AAA family ATPase [Microbacterium sp. EYE_5]|uniref:AAA family ATPase n=1 Tax=unclassified Microbacterium TaxID=2609290 RepID=UPI0020060530|nr:MULTISPECIES: AAA family ATPase [unclassified Microbacterium]MCK6079801.1 AAA family ATPase [Microbacterium sp. EYE_382]MCK6085072.1 AAA family ATPase [Microbacterium sp. EYE_384]MCK6122702.1 AAA family ATPase [Microbacterium sp. EYE_80]MCK6125835.1 AAA family ATPase [Microbacterium sp. EYE_79]MCK6140756.1 AAA family ATPase [Microbacterium sp. EYE_39]